MGAKQDEAATGTQTDWKERYEALIRNVAHDLSAPARHLELAAMTLLDALDEGDPEVISQCRAILENASGRLRKQIDTLLRLSKIADTEVERKPFDGAELIACACFEAELRLSKDQIEELPRLFGAASRFVEIWRHLADNARAHGGSTSLVCSVSVTDSHAEIIVLDDGPGISERLGEQVFEPFVSGTGESQPQHVGAGLALGRALAMAEGGSLSLVRREEKLCLRLTWPRYLSSSPTT